MTVWSGVWLNTTRPAVCHVPLWNVNTAVAGRGATRMADALRLRDVEVTRLGDDVLVTGYVGRPEE